MPPPTPLPYSLLLERRYRFFFFPFFPLGSPRRSASCSATVRWSRFDSTCRRSAAERDSRVCGVNSLPSLMTLRPVRSAFFRAAAEAAEPHP